MTWQVKFSYNFVEKNIYFFTPQPRYFATTQSSCPLFFSCYCKQKVWPSAVRVHWPIKKTYILFAWYAYNLWGSQCARCECKQWFTMQSQIIEAKNSLQWVIIISCSKFLIKCIYILFHHRCIHTTDKCIDSHLNCTTSVYWIIPACSKNYAIKIVLIAKGINVHFDVMSRLD